MIGWPGEKSGLEVWQVIRDEKPREKLTPQSEPLQVLLVHGEEVCRVPIHIVASWEVRRHPRKGPVILAEVGQHKAGDIPGCAELMQSLPRRVLHLSEGG